ncbi:hypothetical protein [Mycetocola zhujimingii]|uniref:hypothetical protein n=1 Tax=Mycetocola zhujimingii TaxID=2079792 RepID=UPI0013C40D6C|nr:hypothetical protein [Mycetocola zhujimingii]
MTGPEVPQAARARHRGPAPVASELEELMGTDVIDVEVEPAVQPLLRFTVAATLCVLGVTFLVVLLIWGSLLPLAVFLWLAAWSFTGTAGCFPGC